MQNDQQTINKLDLSRLRNEDVGEDNFETDEKLFDSSRLMIDNQNDIQNDFDAEEHKAYMMEL